jgi:hypothetical protein
MCTSSFCQFIQVIFILASRDTMCVMARTMTIMKSKTVSKVTGAEESNAEEIAQPSPLIRESQLLSLPCQFASSQICPHDPTPERRLVRTCAHRCCRLLGLSGYLVIDLGTISSPSSIYDGCLNVTAWINANRNRAKSLSDAPIRAWSRFFVSANLSP